MRKSNLENENSAFLVAQFLKLAIAKGQAIMGDETAKANRLYWKIDAILQILKSRHGDDRRLLKIFHQHADPSVRLEAATATLATDLEVSKLVLKQMCDRHEFPFAGDAGMRLHNLDTGFFKPI